MYSLTYGHRWVCYSEIDAKLLALLFKWPIPVLQLPPLPSADSGQCTPVRIHKTSRLSITFYFLICISPSGWRIPSSSLYNALVMTYCRKVPSYTLSPYEYRRIFMLLDEWSVQSMFFFWHKKWKQNSFVGRRGFENVLIQNLEKVYRIKVATILLYLFVIIHNPYGLRMKCVMVRHSCTLPTLGALSS